MHGKLRMKITFSFFKRNREMKERFPTKLGFRTLGQKTVEIRLLLTPIDTQNLPLVQLVQNITSVILSHVASMRSMKS